MKHYKYNIKVEFINGVTGVKDSNTIFYSLWHMIKRVKAIPVSIKVTKN